LFKEIAPVFRIALAATLAVVLAAGSAFGVNQAEINAVNAEIRDTQRLERDKMREIDAKYAPAIRKIGRPDEHLKRERARLGREEKDALALVTDPAAQQKIKAAFDQKRAQLLTKIKGMDQQIKQIKQKRDAEKAQARKPFRQKIHGLRTKVQQLKGNNKGTGKLGKGKGKPDKGKRKGKPDKGKRKGKPDKGKGKAKGKGKGKP
jgi:hypothetical protein